MASTLWRDDNRPESMCFRYRNRPAVGKVKRCHGNGSSPGETGRHGNGGSPRDEAASLGERRLRERRLHVLHVLCEMSGMGMAALQGTIGPKNGKE